MQASRIRQATSTSVDEVPEGSEALADNEAVQSADGDEVGDGAGDSEKMVTDQRSGAGIVEEDDGATNTKSNEEGEYSEEFKHRLSSSSDGSWAGTCPRIQLELNAAGAEVPGLVIVTIKSIQGLDRGWFSVPDPFVEFWMGDEGTRQTWFRKNYMPGHKTEKYWRARTPTIKNATHAAFEWSCLLPFSPEDATFTALVWDSNRVFLNKKLGSVTGNVKEIMDSGDHTESGHADAVLDIKAPEDAESEMDVEPTLNVHFEIVRDTTSYRLEPRNKPPN